MASNTESTKGGAACVCLQARGIVLRPCLHLAEWRLNASMAPVVAVLVFVVPVVSVDVVAAFFVCVVVVVVIDFL